MENNDTFMVYSQQSEMLTIPGVQGHENIIMLCNNEMNKKVLSSPHGRDT